MAGGWKLTLPGPVFVGVPGFDPRLHDLGRDPLERANLFADEPEVVARLTEVLDAWILAHPLESTAGRRRTQAERDQLRGLGYSESGPDDGLDR